MKRREGVDWKALHVACVNNWCTGQKGCQYPCHKGTVEAYNLGEEIKKWAIKFIECEEAQGALEELKGTNSAAAPAEFLRLADAVRDYKARKR